MKRKKSVLCEEDFELKTSSILGIGMGLFARKTIYKDDTIGSYTGIVVTDDEAYAEPYNTSHYMLMVCKDCNIVSEGDAACYTRYLNHSDEPNTTIRSIYPLENSTGCCNQKNTEGAGTLY